MTVDSEKNIKVFSVIADESKRKLKSVKGG